MPLLLLSSMLSHLLLLRKSGCGILAFLLGSSSGCVLGSASNIGAAASPPLGLCHPSAPSPHSADVRAKAPRAGSGSPASSARHPFLGDAASSATEPGRLASRRSTNFAELSP